MPRADAMAHLSGLHTARERYVKGGWHQAGWTGTVIIVGGVLGWDGGRWVGLGFGLFYGCSYMFHLSGNNRRDSHFTGCSNAVAGTAVHPPPCAGHMIRVVWVGVILCRPMIRMTQCVSGEW